MTTKEQVRLLTHIKKAGTITREDLEKLCADQGYPSDSWRKELFNIGDSKIELAHMLTYVKGVAQELPTDKFRITDKGVEFLCEHKDIFISKRVPIVLSVLALLVSLCAFEGIVGQACLRNQDKNTIYMDNIKIISIYSVFGLANSK